MSRDTDARPEPDMVNHPDHYTRGPKIKFQGAGEVLTHTVECIQVIRHIHDYRLATAMKYIWRVAFGGKWDNGQDIAKAIFYLKDYIENPVE